MTLGYTSRNPIIINFTLTLADTWYQVASPVAGVRKWWIKTRVDASTSDNIAFDTAFKDVPSSWWSNCGAGFVIDDCDLMNVWCRSSTAGAIIELMYFG